ncbi:hypothetical protein NQ314_016927 [Rhamnusium bicolor]|uniref:PiggyBac transposable element-derived protein domain-containing protein n=1 Tax=Rhamnusium bicolor TaxID=1586634 RepID=A0AAV8WVU8_9CUCU|nr:hypothetical protein NQ314_016927 [Rhamnusium bicolor]
MQYNNNIYIKESKPYDERCSILDDISSDENFWEDENEIDEDVIEESNHDTDTEQEDEFFSSDDELPLSVINQRQNTSGPKGAVCTLTDPLEIWNCLITTEIISDIVQYTNIYFDKIAKRYSSPRGCLSINSVEIKALFGLLYLADNQRSSHLNAQELRCKDRTGVEVLELLCQ